MYDVLAKMGEKFTEVVKGKVKKATDGTTGDCVVSTGLGRTTAHARWAERGNTSWKELANEALSRLDKANDKLKELGKRGIAPPNPEDYSSRAPYATITFTSQALSGTAQEAISAAIEVMARALVQEGVSDKDLAKLGVSAEIVTKAREAVMVKK